MEPDVTTIHKAHDDVFWAIALAVYATTEMGPEPFFADVPELKLQINGAVLISFSLTRYFSNVRTLEHR
jgi:hypothetical protein